MNEKMCEILQSVMLDDTVEILPDSVLASDLGINSFDLLQVVYDIENEFSISISKEQIKQIITVKDLNDCIEDLAGKM